MFSIRRSIKPKGPHMNTPPTPPPKPSLHLNWQDWLPYLEGSDATDAEKRQLIETLWSIMMAFADHGWDLDSSECSPESSGQVTDLSDVLHHAVLNSQKAQQPESEGA